MKKTLTMLVVCAVFAGSAHAGEVRSTQKSETHLIKHKKTSAGKIAFELCEVARPDRCETLSFKQEFLPSQLSGKEKMALAKMVGKGAADVVLAAVAIAGAGVLMEVALGGAPGLVLANSGQTVNLVGTIGIGGGGTYYGIHEVDLLNPMVNYRTAKILRSAIDGESVTIDGSILHAADHLESTLGLARRAN